MNPSSLEASYQAAAEAVFSADALLIGAGAGMGVDSGLPDFRGNDGFWKAYPPFRGQSFASVSNPKWFLSDPSQAWGFFGHRLNLYRKAIPHDGFGLLKRWGESRPLGYFVFTSNIDGQFQKAGYPQDHVLECHGSIHFLQCVNLCSKAIWSAQDLHVAVDDATIRATSALPRCPHCNAFARPNVLMFGDWGWVEDRSEEQHARYRAWLKECKGKKLVAIELGAGTAVPSVRIECERHAPMMIRINPREADTPDHGIAIPVGALEALKAIDHRR
jgi:NAD-dependent SIR2 family protein deacetylase